MIFLTDRINEEAGNLIYSFAASGYDVQTVVSSYDGYMPEGILSPYEFYVNGKKAPEPGVPRYFNQIDLPDFWEIESSTTSGEIHDYEDLKARLFYADPKTERHLKVIDWLDKNGKVRCSDHYDRNGVRFAQTILDKDQKMVHKTYYDREGREVITENLNTGDIILTDEGKNYFFRSKADFIAHFLQFSGLDTGRILFNSLSTPFFAVEKLRQSVNLNENVLFWQEPIREDIPGNMRSILDRNVAGVRTIAVQRADAYEKIRSLAVDQSRFRRLGYMYPSLRENSHKKEILIFTNSDQVEKISELVRALPEFHFHIGA
ncbi:MAG: accessory Sec system glycosylation chaperone GtfB, partial [Lachnospiraceae bacterium]|nr:accessory Sec system glycosylation chaperone GtfB [Lachnospiraceae bacterium]